MTISKRVACKGRHRPYLVVVHVLMTFIADNKLILELWICTPRYFTYERILDEIHYPVHDYSQARQADPTDPVYPSNLSAALYEVGDYAGCIDAVLRAWRILDGKDTKPDLLVRLSNRLAKALSLGVRAMTISQTDLHANEAGIQELRKAAKTASEGLGNATTADDLVRTWEEWDATASDVKAFAEQSGVAISSLSRLPLFSKPLWVSSMLYIPCAPFVLTNGLCILGTIRRNTTR